MFSIKFRRDDGQALRNKRLVLFVLAAVSAAACAVFGLTWSFAVIAVFTVYILLNIIFAIIRI